ncbi:MAG TPA: DJ-1/PfpI family protein, partial [Leptospiraceae bacterium]|nr:DJ-1/PfpI family protein [Leptospiraceae bacterium]
WIPISAKILNGKKATGSRGIKDDLENAGAIWVDEPVVRDGNLISSRTPVDLPAFGRAITEYLADHS